MYKIFYFGVLGLIIFEISNVYFIMPLPGSQQIESIELAYFLFSYRWIFRIGFVCMILWNIGGSIKSNKWVSIIALCLAAIVVYVVNFKMAADQMFYQPTLTLMKNHTENKVNGEKIILGVEINGEARAYPIQLIGYHHQVLDTIRGKSIMVTYCTVCRTGRVYEPIVNGKTETFRLVGMDHFNAMFEDKTTKSWWRQATGEAVIGKFVGNTLPEVFSQQMSLNKWLSIYPDSKVMQPDPTFIDKYDQMEKYETGKSIGDLTRTDSLSWKNKSWIVGVEINQTYKAYDWNLLMKERVINDTFGGKPIVIALAEDNKSFVAYLRPSYTLFNIKNDSLVSNGLALYDINGTSKDGTQSLTKVKVYQEFWHSWQTFHPKTEKFSK